MNRTQVGQLQGTFFKTAEIYGETAGCVVVVPGIPTKGHFVIPIRAAGHRHLFFSGGGGGGALMALAADVSHLKAWGSGQEARPGQSLPT